MSYYGAPGSYGGPPGYGGYPPQSSSPPGMAPGMSGPPGGMNQSQHPLPARPGAYPSNFQIPPNMPKFDMNASVIRLGTTGPSKNDMGSAPRDGGDRSGGGGGRGSNNEPLGQRRGLGMDRNLEQQRQQIRESMQALLPPKSDEVLKTIFVGNITEGCAGDAGIEDILRSAGSLRKWTRAIDADNKPCTFGFAEYEDSESLETAAEILSEVYVPVRKQHPKKQDKDEGENGDAEGEVEKAKLLVIVDDASKEYAENWAQQRGDTEDDKQFRFDGARESLNNVLARLFHPTEEHDFDGDITMQETAQTQDPITGEVISVPIAQAEDELSDIPAEMRETVAAEIAAFRDRSNRRDLERLRREEEIEARDRFGGRTTSSIPTGPGGANGIPVGPKGVQGAPSGPKGLRGVQIPKDYQNGVSFTNGSSELDKYLSAVSGDDTDASDGELERRRRDKKDAEQDKEYLDYERRWLNRERARGAALERERKKDESDAKRLEEGRTNMARMLKEWDDDAEASRKSSEYYADRAAWAKHRLAFRSREIQNDAVDRRDEENERRAQQSAEDQARGMADAFLDRQAEELGARGFGTEEAQKPAFKISLGAAAQKARQAAEAPKRKAAADVENLLDVDEAGADDAAKRTLVPISFDTAAEGAALTEDERVEIRRQLAFSIPQDKDGLFAWSVKWEGLTTETIEERLRPFVEKRSMEHLGVVEELMWDVVKKTLDRKGSASELVDELEGLLEDETEGFVKKVWRMVVFYSESEVRGLNTTEAA